MLVASTEINLSLVVRFKKVSGGGSSRTVGFYITSATGTGTICANVTNNCGTTMHCQLIWASDEGCGGGRSGHLSDTCEANHEDNNEQLVISPNPANNLLIVQFPKSFQETTKIISIIDIYGKVIHEANTLHSTIEFNLERFASGNYIIKCKAEDKIIRY